MTPGDTIAAIASGPGRSPRGLVRLSGPTAFDALAAFTGAATHNGATFAVLRMGAEGGAAGSLPVQVLRSSGPRTYTGEDTVEVLLPGNPALLERVLGMFLGFAGVRAAEPGEFSARAYLAGKLTLTQAEGVADVISAASEMELACAKATMREGSGREYEGWAEGLATMLALVEAGVDFSDQEDVVAISPRDLQGRLKTLAQSMSLRLMGSLGSEQGDWRPRVVLVGKPNAGKSTLFNALLGRRRAVVSDVAGTTRDVLAEEWRRSEGSLTMLLADLPGVDGAGGDAEIDAEAQRAARGAALGADVVLWCDPTGGFETAEALDVRPTARVIRVVTKGDLPGGRLSTECLRVCAIDGHGIGELRRQIESAAWGAPASPGGQGSAAPLLSRHRRALAQALSMIQAVARSIDTGERQLVSPELVATNLREALDALGALTGRISADDVIGRVFSKFCIGK